MALRTLLLIPESTRKAKGGGPSPSGSSVDDALPRDVRRRLAVLRDQVREVAPEGIGPSAELLPAYRRFRGNMYRAIPEKAWEARVEGVEVVMVSGLYGIVASRDPVLEYHVSMAESLGRLGKLNRWWRDHGLPAVLHSYVESVHPGNVVDLLSLEYREAVAGFSGGLPETKGDVVNFRGLGRASQPRRGKLVAEYLRGEKV